MGGRYSVKIVSQNKNIKFGKESVIIMTEKEKVLQFAEDLAQAYESIWHDPKYKKVRNKVFKIIAEKMDEQDIEPSVENVQALKMLLFKKVIFELYDSHEDFKENVLNCLRFAEQFPDIPPGRSGEQVVQCGNYPPIKKYISLWKGM